MPYELRNFLLLSKDMLMKNHKVGIKQWISDTFPDIYVYKQNSSSIGVKFRDIEDRKYGYKIRSVQVKIDQSSYQNQSNTLADPHIKFFQNWRKYEIRFKYKLYRPEVYESQNMLNKLKQKQMQKIKQGEMQALSEQQIITKFASYSSQLEHLNQKLIQTLKTYLSKKKHIHDQLSEQNFVTKWLDRNVLINQLFVVRKNKQKSWNWETGLLSIQTYSGNKFKLKEAKQQNKVLKKEFKNEQMKQKQQILLPIIFFQTLSTQNSDRKMIQRQINKQQVLKNDNKKLTFSQLYENSRLLKNESLILNVDKTFKFNYNTSYPQILEDIYQNYTLQKQNEQMKYQNILNSNI